MLDRKKTLTAVFLQGVPKNVNKLEKNRLAPKSDESTIYRLVDRENLNLNLDTSFVKIG